MEKKNNIQLTISNVLSHEFVDEIINLIGKPIAGSNSTFNGAEYVFELDGEIAKDFMEFWLLNDMPYDIKFENKNIGVKHKSS